jgi:hypothetical protein
MSTGIFRFAALLLFAAAMSPCQAHHSFAMFDYAKEVTIHGTVREFRWENPHTHISVIVAPGAADASMVGTWDLEAASLNILARQGWTRDSYKVGDKITAVGHPLKSGDKGLSLFYVIRPDGTRMYQDVSRPPEGK